MPGLLHTLFRRRRILPMVLPLRPEECSHRYPADQDQSDRQYRASPTHPLARGFTDCNAPLGTEQIYAVREVPRRGNDPDQIKHPSPPVLKLGLHLVKRGIRMCEQVCSGEAHGVGVPDDVNKGDAAGPALGRIHEISRPGIIADVGFAAKPDIEPVKRMVQKRNIDADNFKNQNEGQPSKKLYLRAIRIGAIGGKGVGNEMLKQECTNWDDPAERVQATKKERMAFTGTNRWDSALDRRGNASHVPLYSDQIC